MKVIRDEDKKSNTYIKKVKIKKRKKTKHNSKSLNDVNVTTKNYNDLVVYMADGSKPRYANIPEYKKKLLEIRRQQYIKNKDELVDLKNNLKLYTTLLIVCIGITAVSIPIASIVNGLSAILYSISCVSTASGIISAVLASKYYSKINDVKKYEFFDDNISTLNSVDLDNPNILERVKNKDKRKIYRIKKEKDFENEKPYFENISIDGLSLDALKRIKDNILRENYFALSTSKKENNDTAESKGKPLVKK